MRATRSIHFPVSIDWAGGRLVRAAVPGKETISIATPPEFKGTDVGVWSPEDFLVAAAASCFTVTYLAVAERRGVAVHDVAVDGVGRMGIGEDGRLGFLGIDLSAHLVPEPGQEEAAVEAARRAEQGCFVSQALSVPVRLETLVRAVAPAPAA
jgi:organic hydroperoxide reductase OsmC/OhrA